MKKPEWNDKQLEELLQQMPKIDDSREPQKIHENISSKINKRKKTMWYVPAFATVAALFLVMLLVPALMNNTQNFSSENAQIEQKSSSSAADEGVMDRSFATEESAEIAKNELESNANDAGVNKADRAIQTTKIESYVVNESELAGNTIVTFGLPDKNVQNVIPISFLVSENGRTSFDLFLKKRKALPEEQLGLGNFSLANTDISEVAIGSGAGKKVKMNVPVDHSFGDGSATERMFFLSIQETFRWLGYKEIDFYTDGRTGIELAHTGEVKSMQIEQEQKKGYFLYQANENAPILLTPSNTSYDDLITALTKMKEEIKAYELKPSIPEEVRVEKVERDGSHVTITFSEETTLDNTESYILMIDAIMLTAREFGFETVSFAGTDIEMIGNIVLNIENKVPVAPNLITNK